jgi:hypothetical protein
MRGLILAVLVAGAATAPPGAVLDRELGDPRIAESSGLTASALHDGVLWTHNDSGGEARLYAIGPDGSTVATVEIGGVQARDWEAVAVADLGNGPELWVADIGDNRGVRDRGVLVHRLAEPAELVDGSAPVRSSYRLRYPDAPVDAEAIAVDVEEGRLLVVTKELLGAGAYAASLPLDPDGPTVLERVGPAPLLVTDAAALPDGRVALLTYGGVYAGTPETGWGEPAPVPDLEQGESLAVVPGGGQLYVGSEGLGSAVWRVPLPPEGTPSATPDPAAGTAVPGMAPPGPAGTSAHPSGEPADVHGVEQLPLVPLGAFGAAVALVLGLHGASRRRRRR